MIISRPRNKKDLYKKINSLIKIAKNGCWIWLGSCRDYPILSYKFKKINIRKFLFKKDENKYLSNTCKNKKCVNPKHSLYIQKIKDSKFRTLDDRKKYFYERFKKNELTGCWLWTGKLTSRGYGRSFLRPDRMDAHRLSWIIHREEPLLDLHVCHKCDIRNCVNPDHLFLGTNKDNMDDKNRKGRGNYKNQQSHCQRGHEFSTENTYFYNFHGKIKRTCKICRKIYQQKYSQKKRSLT